MADELAQHVVDIDVYHTTKDKSAYNGGLFWHTYHYGDADTVDASNVSRVRQRPHTRRRAVIGPQLHDRPDAPVFSDR